MSDSGTRVLPPDNPPGSGTLTHFDAHGCPPSEDLIYDESPCLAWKAYVRVDSVPEPQIQGGGDVLIRVTSTAICGSDLHHVHRYLAPLLAKIEAGEIDPSFVVTHTVSIDEAPAMYKTFRDKKDGCIKVVLKPHAA